uniref:Lipid membrane protein n=1 Tax=Pithovirus LCDPAC01 TaxID=2506600 RepID=A0A481YMY5_9VIRU|nr:MAG: lipid membrane protein [Pithovirus LCDPAC01]
MGLAPSIDTAVNNVKQTSINTFFQFSKSTCSPTCTEVISGIDINIGAGAEVSGIEIKETCNPTADCMLKTELKTLESTQLKAVQLAEAKDKGKSLFTWPGLSVNTTVNNIDQELRNTITQSIISSCNPTSSQLLENVTINVGNDAKVIGKKGEAGIEFIQDANVNALCSITNLASLKAFNSADAKQTAKSTTGGLPLILIIILAVILIGTIVYMLNKNRKKGKPPSKKGKSKVKLATRALSK